MKRCHNLRARWEIKPMVVSKLFMGCYTKKKQLLLPVSVYIHAHLQFMLYIYLSHMCPLTTGWSCVPGIMALASCICWASMAMFFCWMRLFLPLISSWVFRWGGGCRYLQFSLEQRPWWGERGGGEGGNRKEGGMRRIETWKEAN